MVAILYLAHDLDDSAIWRRVSMLRAGGAKVTVAGFRRGALPLPGDARVLGVTRNGRMWQRLAMVLRALRQARQTLGDLPRPDVILARNLEMLAVARRAQRLWPGWPEPGLAYEVLDIHRMMLGPGLRARAMRAVERRLMRRAGLVLTSSPGFLDPYFRSHGQLGPTTAVQVIENKVNGFDAGAAATSFAATPSAVPTIGWFGILRCAASLSCLDAVTRARPGQIRVVLAGRPALDAIPAFHATVAANPDLEFRGPYRNPDDLPQLYGAVHLSWLVDRYDAGLNSDWLLPNRLYEGCLHGAVPIALAGSEVARRTRELGVGVILPGLGTAEVGELLAAMEPAHLAQLAAAVRVVPRATWVADVQDAADLVRRLARLGGPSRPGPAAQAVALNGGRTMTGGAMKGGVLIVIPALNEAAHIGRVIDGLMPFAARAGARIVVADGGSVDGTQSIAAQRSVTVLANPARLQAAGINLAVDIYGKTADWLIRVDAHAAYPDDFCDVLLAEAARSGADSVVVGMHAVGQGLWQGAIAAAQNSRFGNGGAAHRLAPDGQFVDHGHHALMRVGMFRALGGYDAAFSHNEDAEFDLRLRAAGGRIWLTGATRITYFPRRTLRALVRQYYLFGFGRAENMLKHRGRPRLRQMVVIALAPALALAVMAPLHGFFAAPLVVWALACVTAGVMIARATGDRRGLLAGVTAGVMHAAWSAGFWSRMGRAARPSAAPAGART
jgi:succinoglycan biosynthesis protein ExoA